MALYFRYFLSIFLLLLPLCCWQDASAQSSGLNLADDLVALEQDIKTKADAAEAKTASIKLKLEKESQLEEALKQNERSRQMALKNSNIPEPPFSCECYTSFCLGGGDPRRYATPKFLSKSKAERQAIGDRYDAKKEACEAFAAAKVKISKPYLKHAKEIKAAFKADKFDGDSAQLEAVVNGTPTSALSPTEISKLDAALNSALNKERKLGLVQNEARNVAEQEAKRDEQERLTQIQKEKDIKDAAALKAKTKREAEIARRLSDHEKSCATTWARGVWPCGCPRPEELKKVSGAVCSK